VYEMSYQAYKKHLIPAIRLSRYYKQQSVNKKAATKLTRKYVTGQGEVGGVHDVTKQLKLDLDKPLSHALDQVFNNQGTVLLAFQGSSHDQVV